MTLSSTPQRLRVPPRPMLAAKASQSDLAEAFARHGLFWAFPKLDGIRGLSADGGLLSRALKRIPNAAAQSRWSGEITAGLDGELLATPAWHHDACRLSTSAFMTASAALPHSARYHVFDCWNSPERPFHQRYMRALKTTQSWPTMGLELVGFKAVRSMDEMLEVEAEALVQGYEGLILRLPTAPYKPGRSTLREGGMIKVKRTLDAEARVVGMVELEHNENAAQINELGLTRRSSQQEGKFGAGVLGALVCELPSGVRFNIGTGFSAAERQIVWVRRHEYLGQMVKFRYFGHGEHERPRHPRFLAWRHEEDLGGDLP